MIKVNGRKCEWQKGLTIEELLILKKYTFPKIIVKVNGKLIPKKEYTSTVINDGDEVQAIHLLAGG